MSLIKKADVIPGSRKFPGKKKLADAVMKRLKFDELNTLYDSLSHKDGLDFVEGILDALNIQINIDEAELAQIPKEGPFITISNHPFGGLDGIILLHLIGKIRPDFKIMANFMLNEIPPIHNFLIPVNPFGPPSIDVSNYSGIKASLEHLKESPLGIFPSGEVSSFQFKQQAITDKEWEKSIVKLIKKADVPVVPIYFQGTNSLGFQTLGLLHEKLKLAKLPSELVKKKNETVKVRIGSPIPTKKTKEFKDVNELGRFLRAKVYYLGNPIKVNNFFKYKNIRLKQPDGIAVPQRQSDLIIELNGLSDAHKLFKTNNFAVYCAKALEIPTILEELGRLREITFRAAGEGTNKSKDLDEYDLYYDHLFIWDEKEDHLVGAYRIGDGQQIYKTFGKRGFYLHSLFRVKNEFGEILKQSAELGRSFIVPDYQRNPIALFLLWKGILHYLMRHPNLNYVIGPVSISNQYTKLSKDLIVDFIQTNHFNPELARWITPRRKFRFARKTKKHFLHDLKPKTIRELDSLIEEIEPNHFRVPVLLKKYLKENAMLIGFNVDPKFNNCLDGLMYLDCTNLNPSLVKMLSEELGETQIRERFGLQIA